MYIQGRVKGGTFCAGKRVQRGEKSVTIKGGKNWQKEKGTTLKRKEQNTGKRNKTQEKGTKLKKKGPPPPGLPAQGGGGLGGQSPPCPPLVAAPGKE